MPLKGEYEPSAAQLVRDHVELYESSGGTQGTTPGVLVTREEDEKLGDVLVVLLTTLGAKSGKIRKSPVNRVEHDGSYAAVASAGGAPSTRSGTTTRWPTPGSASRRLARQDMRAREVTGHEKALWWARADEAFPEYAEHHKNMDRDIPVLVLEPAAQAH
ncbi:nitroreductase/quinone reductase family protein [Streptomyces sp. NBC_01314]|uniref:nitroreductase/quinone reductase family protein n=1 Tax=Streptomyces sp. NBC_01314 TaxID=2903821 RepID=UPI003088152E|nr:nitroreductase family deazaflavin-dependent oxidoreductase [Streptomyces sp. NBC_01314]